MVVGMDTEEKWAKHRDELVKSLEVRDPGTQETFKEIQYKVSKCWVMKRRENRDGKDGLWWKMILKVKYEWL